MAANDLASLVVKTELINTGFVGPMRENTRAAQQFQREMGKSAAAGQAGSKSMSRFGVITQQAGYQAQDFAVQVAGGQSAMVAMAQQGSQMLGVFGPSGAIAGAILAVGVLVARISGVGESSEKAAEKTRELTLALRELELAKGGGDSAKLRFSEEDADAAQKAYDKTGAKILEAKSKLAKLLDRRAQTSDTNVFESYTGSIIATRLEIDKLVASWKDMAVGLVKSSTDVVNSQNAILDAEKNSAEEWSEKLRKDHGERLNAIEEEDKALVEQFNAKMRAFREEQKAAASSAADRQKSLDEIEEDIKAQKKLAESIRQVIDPTRKLIEQRKIAQGLADRGYLDQNEVEPYIAKLSEVKEKIDSVTQEMNSMWNSVSDRAGQAFADMVLTGENAFDQLADIVARSMLEIVTRMAIINPLLNSLFNFSGTSILPAFFGVGKLAGSASGGNFSAGDVKLVGENGPELFTSDRAGTIHQAGATRGMMRGDKSGGDVFNISYSFAAGVTHRELAQMIPALINQTKSSILDARARGASA